MLLTPLPPRLVGEFLISFKNLNNKHPFSQKKFISICMIGLFCKNQKHIYSQDKSSTGLCYHAHIRAQIFAIRIFGATNFRGNLTSNREIKFHETEQDNLVIAINSAKFSKFQSIAKFKKKLELESDSKHFMFVKTSSYRAV